MKLIDIVNGPWAITPEMLLEIQGIYATHLRGEKIDLEAVEARVGKPLANSRMNSQVVDGVAVISIDGTIAKKMNLFSSISGGASSQMVAKDIESALNDFTVKGIILNVDSPGGTVDGTAELAEFIYQARGKKPIVCFSDGMIASAAYWIASACDQISISGDTNPVGSIGVIASHRDFSKYEERMGVKTTEITAGKYKRIASQYEPLSKDGRAEIQEKVDYLYSVFVNTVARNRGVSTDTVLSDMADGRVFTGRQSITAGLVDGVSTLGALIDDMQDPQKREEMMKHKAEATTTITPPSPPLIKRGCPKGGGLDELNEQAPEEIMTVETLRKDHADLVAQITAEAQAGMVPQADASAATTAAVAAEQTRCSSLVSAAFGEDAGKKFAAVAAKGLTAEEMAELGITIAPAASQIDSDSRAAILAAIKEAAPQGLTGAKQSGEAEERKAAVSAIADGANSRR